MSSFRLVPLSLDQFAPLFALGDAELAAIGARRCVVTENPGFPCRVSLVDAEVGEEVLLLPYEHHVADSPYRASGPIYVRRAARSPEVAPGDVPPYVTRRLISLRAYDRRGTMVGADVMDGREIGSALERTFTDAQVAYVHLHNAKPGCFSVAVERV